MIFLRSLNWKALTLFLTIGVVLTVLVALFLGRGGGTQPSTPIQGMNGVEKIEGPGEVNVDVPEPLTVSAEETLTTQGWSMPLFEEIDGVAEQTVHVEEVPHVGDIDVEATISEYKGNTKLFGGVFERPQYPAYSAIWKTDTLNVATSKVEDFYLLGEQLVDFPNPQDTLLREIRNNTENTTTLSYGTISTGQDNTVGVYLITQNAESAAPHLEAYMWNNTHIVRLTGALMHSGDTFPQWLTTHPITLT